MRGERIGGGYWVDGWKTLFQLPILSNGCIAMATPGDVPSPFRKYTILLENWLTNRDSSRLARVIWKTAVAPRPRDGVECARAVVKRHHAWFIPRRSLVQFQSAQPNRLLAGAAIAQR
jgi:hypothetical protein